MNWEPIIDKAFNFGVPAAIVFVMIACCFIATSAVGYFIAPMLRETFNKGLQMADKHIAYLDTSTETMKGIKDSVLVSKTSHERTHDALHPLADAIHAAAPLELKNEVRPHIERVKQALQQ